MAREERKIIFSIQPYEDTKSIVSFVVFIIIGLLALIVAAIYYLIVGLIIVAKWFFYYLTWPWWFPAENITTLLNAIEKQKGSLHAWIIFGICCVATWIIAVLGGMIAKSCRVFIFILPILILIMFWLTNLICYIAIAC